MNKPVRISRYALIAAMTAVAGCQTYGRQSSTVGDYLSGRYAARTNDVNTAADAFVGAQSDAQGSTELLRDAFFYQLAAGNIEAAIPHARRLAALEDADDDGLAAAAIAAYAIKNGRYAEARTLLADGVEPGYLFATLKIVRAWAIAGAEGPRGGLGVLADASSDEFKGFYPLHQAIMAEQAGMAPEARAAHQISIATFGGPVGRAAYGAFLERAGDDAAANKYYEALANNSALGRHIADAGAKRLEQGRPSQAYGNITPAQGAAIAYYSLGAAILEQTVDQRAAAERAGFRVGTANYNVSLVLSQLALYLYPDLDVARRFAGSILNVYGEHDRAIEMLSTIKLASPYYEQSQIEIAAAYNSLESTDNAIDVLRSAIRRNPSANEARLSLAGLFAIEDRHAEAVETLDTLIAWREQNDQESDWRHYISRAASLLELDDWPRAEADLERSVEIAPDEATTLNYLGYSWAERGVNLDEAFALIERAVELDPSSGAIIDSLGWAHFQLGRYDDAVGHLEQAAALEPADPTITDHLGDVYWRLGRALEARYQWERVMELEPDEKLAAAVTEKLAQGLPETDE